MRTPTHIVLHYSDGSQVRYVAEAAAAAKAVAETSLPVDQQLRSLPADVVRRAREQLVAEGLDQADVTGPRLLARARRIHERQHLAAS